MNAHGRHLPVGSLVKVEGSNVIAEVVGVKRIKPRDRWRSIYEILIGRIRVRNVRPSYLRRFLA